MTTSAADSEIVHSGGVALLCDSLREGGAANQLQTVATLASEAVDDVARAREELVRIEQDQKGCTVS